MTKKWIEVKCDFSMKTYVEVRFFNTESDFRSTRYPCVDEAIDSQQKKLGRDVISHVGKDLMDELLECLVG